MRTAISSPPQHRQGSPLCRVVRPPASLVVVTAGGQEPRRVPACAHRGRARAGGAVHQLHRQERCAPCRECMEQTLCLHATPRLDCLRFCVALKRAHPLHGPLTCVRVVRRFRPGWLHSGGDPSLVLRRRVPRPQRRRYAAAPLGRPGPAPGAAGTTRSRTTHSRTNDLTLLVDRPCGAANPVMRAAACGPRSLSPGPHAAADPAPSGDRSPAARGSSSLPRHAPACSRSPTRLRASATSRSHGLTAPPCAAVADLQALPGVLAAVRESGVSSPDTAVALVCDVLGHHDNSGARANPPALR
jgi:hypothetical protein